MLLLAEARVAADLGGELVVGAAAPAAPEELICALSWLASTLVPGAAGEAVTGHAVEHGGALVHVADHLGHGPGMTVFEQIRPMAKVLTAGRRNRYDQLRWLRHRPQILTATAAYEMALLGSARVNPRLKQLAELKAAALVTCEFCLDVGSALATATGVSERQLRDLPRFAGSDAFSPDEKLVLEFAQAVSGTPAQVPDELRDRLLKRFSPAQLTELAATVAWENQRGRLNQALGVRPAGFSDGAVCAIPER